VKLEAKILLSLKEDEWNNLLYNSPTSTAYQTSNWIKSYKTIPDSKPLFIQIETASGKIVGQLASIIHKNYLRNENVVAKNIGWKFNISSILTWSYGPVIYDLDNYPEILSLIISKVVQIAKENNVVMIRGSTAPLDQNNSRKLFEENGFNFQPWSTYVISLNETINNLYSTLDKKTKYDIRKSEKKKCNLSKN